MINDNETPSFALIDKEMLKKKTIADSVNVIKSLK